MMSVPLHDILLSRRLWTAAARRRFEHQSKAQSSLRTPKASLRLLPEKCRGNHFSKLRASVFRAAQAALLECGGSTPLCPSAESAVKPAHSKDISPASAGEMPGKPLLQASRFGLSSRDSGSFGVRRLDAALTRCRKRSQACALQRHLSGFCRRNAGEITSPCFALRSFEPRQRLFRSAAARRRFANANGKRKSGLKRPHSKRRPVGSPVEAFHPRPMSAMIMFNPFCHGLRRTSAGPSSRAANSRAMG
jgi:hypothetical protein